MSTGEKMDKTEDMNTTKEVQTDTSQDKAGDLEIQLALTSLAVTMETSVSKIFQVSLTCKLGRKKKMQ